MPNDQVSSKATFLPTKLIYTTIQAVSDQASRLQKYLATFLMTQDPALQEQLETVAERLVELEAALASLERLERQQSSFLGSIVNRSFKMPLIGSVLSRASGFLPFRSFELKAQTNKLKQMVTQYSKRVKCVEPKEDSCDVVIPPPPPPPMPMHIPMMTNALMIPKIVVTELPHRFPSSLSPLPSHSSSGSSDSMEPSHLSPHILMARRTNLRTVSLKRTPSGTPIPDATKSIKQIVTNNDLVFQALLKKFHQE